MGALIGFLLALLQVGAVLEWGVLSTERVFGALAVGVPTAVAGGTMLTVLAAIYPTLVAAKMKPVDAMRVEV